ncbi:MAG: hypothetical protein AAGK04_05580 [Planctomycetota bacterium]
MSDATTDTANQGRGDLLAVLRPGMRVRITRQMPRLTKSLETTVEGEVLRVGQQKTGSWFAHSKDNKLWIDRVELRKADGELVTCNLDQYSRVEVLGS